jgi:lysophospholipase L1-like esterase
MRRPVVLLVIALLVFAGVMPTAHARPAPAAIGSWTLEPQSKDANGDGFIDGDGGVPRRGALTIDPSSTYVGAGNRIAQPNERLIDGNLSWYIPRKGYTVNLDACQSRGSAHEWTIRKAGRVITRTKSAPLRKSTCVQPVVLKEGRYTFTLSVTGSGRTKKASYPAQVKGLTILSLGDSYASGEGNPRNIDAWLGLRNPIAAFTPYWDDDKCRRSTRAAPAQAALAIEKSDPRTPVTFVHLACSGATIANGVLGPQSASGQPGSQIDQARKVLRGHRVDAVLLSIGGNDIGFTSLLENCLLNANCPLRPVTTGPLAGYATAQAGVQAVLGQLGPAYQSVANAVADIAPGAPIFITMYPDITRNANGGPCIYLTMTPSDFAWARETILTPTPGPNYAYRTTTNQTVNFPLANGTLNAQIAATAGIGMRPVTGSWSASGDSAIGHGICAGRQSWVLPANLNGNSRGAFHPNPAGQVAIAQAIEAELQSIR